MNFNVRVICGKYQEMTVDAIETGTLYKGQAIRLAQKMVSAAEDLLFCAGLRVNSDACGAIAENLEQHLQVQK